MAGVKFGTSSSPELLQQINVELPAEIAKRFHGSKIVALSTGCVYPFVSIDSGGSKETDEPDPPGQYAQSCLGREQAFAEFGERVCLIRLNYAVDLRYGVLVDIAKKILDNQPIDLSTGYANVIWQGDANSYIIRSLTTASSPPFVLNVTGSETLRIRDVAERFGRIFQKPVTLLGSEASTAWLSNASLCHDLFGPPSVTENVLIEWVANWLASGGKTLNKPTHFEVRDGTF